MIFLSIAEMKKFIQSLNPDETLQVLWQLIDKNPDIAKKAYEIAMKISCNVDADSIAEDVYIALNALDVEDLNDRAGKTLYGYVEPSEAAYEMFEEALQPFIDEMIKNQERALPVAAKSYCIGVIKGLLMYEKESESDFADWVPDAPGDFIDNAIYDYKKGNPSDDDIAEVMAFAQNR